MASNEFRLASTGINNEGKLPRKYTGEGQGAQKDISPPLEWYNIPEGTKSLAVVVEDLDGGEPDGPITYGTLGSLGGDEHTAYNQRVPEGSGKQEEMGGDYTEIEEGINYWKLPNWRGPILSSHSQSHRFEFKVSKEKLLDSMEGHVLGEAVMMAIF
ncbi:hypothetical protein ACHQM5_005218 [Ranunculus cassubicifolius]